MKKLLCIFLLTILCFGLCACSTNSSKSSDDDYNETYETDTNIITKSEAEGLATTALYRQLKATYLYIDDYDMSQTKYSIASISGSSSSGYEVNGTYSLYDKYGNFQKRNNFSVNVSSDGIARVTEH